MARKLILALAGCFFPIAALLAQTGRVEVTGIVIDEESVPVAGAGVVLKGTTIGVSTEADGTFRLEMESPGPEFVLEFSFIGMKPREVKVKPRDGKADMEVVLEMDQNELDQVVVTGIFNRRKEIRKLMDSIHARAEESGRFVHVFFDAVNECLVYKDSPDEQGPLALYEAIRSIFAGGDYPRFKVLFTCRSYTWKNLFHRCAARDAGLLFRSSGNDDEATAVRGFNDAELEQAYAIYRRLYQMETPFESLAGTSKIRLKDPLVLKIACTNYLGRELPQQTRPYASIALFGKMLDDISRSYAGNMQRRIIEMLAAYILDSYEHGMPVDSISSRALRSACGDSTSPLHEMANAIYKNDGITIAYGELLNKPERPVLRFVESVDGDGSGQIQFIYERFLEYVMALSFVGRERAAAGGAPIPPQRWRPRRRRPPNTGQAGPGHGRHRPDRGPRRAPAAAGNARPPAARQPARSASGTG